VIGSPHNSGIVAGVLQTAARMAAENVRRYLRGEPFTGLVRREDYVLPG
jgi:phosphoglycerate dehydrogenase-like enzyme